MPQEITDLKSRRRYAGEEAFFPLVAELGHARLRQAFIRLGLTPRQAGALVWFLEDQINLDRHTSEKARWDSRQMLLQFTPEEVRLASQPIGG